MCESNKDKANIIRTAFIRDIDKIIHCPYIEWRVIRVFDELGHQIRQES